MNTYKVSGIGSGSLQLGVEDQTVAILQAVQIILTTPKGTVPMYRDFGVNMDFLDLPIPAAEQRARMEIREAVEKWEPGVRVNDITFARDEAHGGKLIPTVEVEIINE